MKQRSANGTDKAIGVRLRAARIGKGLSQEQLGAALGVSFQQVQKYELGRNRIAASRLAECARLLGKPIAWFFEGVEGSKRFNGEPDLGAQILSSGFGRRLVVTYLDAEPRDRAAILAVADALAPVIRPRLQKVG